MKRFGGLHCAFNNAGVEQDPQPLTEQAEGACVHIMDTNVKGVSLYLLSARASFVTGHTLVVDGGFSAG